jgi:hypothetical protein
MDELLNVEGAYCLAWEGMLYIVYLPAGSHGAQLRATLSEPLQLRWFNPREGGELMEGSVNAIEGEGNLSLGNPPSDPDLDWVAVVGRY